MTGQNVRENQLYRNLMIAWRSYSTV